MSDKNIYSKEEDEFIRVNAATMTYEEIAIILNRTSKGISNRATRIGVVKLRRWTPEEDNFILASAGIPIEEVANTLKRNVSEVSRRWGIIGNGVTWRSRIGYKPDADGRPVVGYQRRNGHSHRIMEHRQTVEIHLDRKLSHDEIVHHVNTIKTDNRIENLYLCNNREHHKHVHISFEKLLPQLLEMGIVVFNWELGEYALCES